MMQEVYTDTFCSINFLQLIRRNFVMTTGTLACLSFNMKYKKNIFGKIINEENEKNFFLNNLENNSNPYIRKKIGVLHSFAGWLFMIFVFAFF